MQDIRLLLCFKLLLQIPSDDSGEVADVPDIGKILTKDLLFRRKILFFPGKHFQHTDVKIPQSADFCGCI